jgi:short-subunit dehydrogenase
MEVNFFGVALLTRALLPYLRASRGRVVNISSVFGYTGMPLTAAYCASKFALEGLSEALYHELRPHGVQVAVVQPGGHRTRFGQNSRWSNDRCSTYGVQRANYQNLQSKLMTRKAVSADHVAAIAEKLLLCPVMPLRVRAGRDAAVAHWLRRLLPEFLSLAVTSRVYDRIFTNPVAVPSLPSSLEIQP